MTYPAYPTTGVQGPPAQSPASSGTAIAAGVLAILGSLWAVTVLFLLAIGIVALSEYNGNVPSMVWVQGIVSLVVHLLMMLLLGVGAILLFTRKSAGRWMVVTGSVIATLGYAVNLVIGLATSSNVDAEGVAMVSGGVVIVFIVPAILTLLLAALPATGRWLEEGKRPAGGYPHPGYPAAQW